MVSFEFGQKSSELLNQLGVPAEVDSENRGTVFKAFNNMGHEADDRELEDLVKWLKSTIP